MGRGVELGKGGTSGLEMINCAPLGLIQRILMAACPTKEAGELNLYNESRSDNEL